MEKITQSLTPLELVAALNKTIEKVNCIQSHYLGDLVLSYSDAPQEGRVRLDGAEYTAALFPDFYAVLDSGKFPTSTYEAWQNSYIIQKMSDQ
mgnify:CR=1 FL=1